jgi:hypothetical protein
VDISNKFDAMFHTDPDAFPLDELEEDFIRRQTGVFTGSCEKALAEYRLAQGGIEATNVNSDL